MHKRTLSFLCLLLLVVTRLSFTQESKSLLRAADSVYRTRNFAASASLYESATRAEPANGLIHYYAARAFALAGNKDKAWLFLDQSIDRGWHQVQLIQRDEALASLRSDPRWGAMVRKAQVAKEEFAPIDSLIKHLNTLSAHAYMYRVRPKHMGGGDKSYVGFQIPAHLDSTFYGTFVAQVLHADTIFFVANSATVKGSIETKMDATGRLGIGGWKYTGELKALSERWK